MRTVGGSEEWRVRRNDSTESIYCCGIPGYASLTYDGGVEGGLWRGRRRFFGSAKKYGSLASGELQKDTWRHGWASTIMTSLPGHLEIAP